jgi:hypothetical protein
MSDVCTPFAECGDLDSRVLFQRSVYGPPVVSDPGSLPFGALAIQGAAVRPYVDLHFELRWVPRDLCLGPISSVMTLAPSEAVTIATRTEHRTSFTDLVRSATDSSSVSTHTRQGPEPPPAPIYLFGQPGGGAGGQIADPFGQTTSGVVGAVLAGSSPGSSPIFGGGLAMGNAKSSPQARARDTVELRPMYAKGYGSFFSDIEDAVVAIGTGGASIAVDAVAGGLSEVVKNGVGSAGQPGAAVGATISAIAEVIDSISRSESQTHLSETTHSVEDTTSTSVVRTFSNPYRDRTLQLRFMPVFRRFDAAVSIVRARLGLAMTCGHLDFTTTNIGSRYAHVLATAIDEPNLVRVAGAEIGGASADFHPGTGVLQDHLQANAAMYTKRFLHATAQARDEETLHGAFSELLSRNTSSENKQPGDIGAGLACPNPRSGPT